MPLLPLPQRFAAVPGRYYDAGPEDKLHHRSPDTDGFKLIASNPILRKE